jgi:hypothetical protein
MRQSPKNEDGRRHLDLLVRAEAAALGGAPGDAVAPLHELVAASTLERGVRLKATWLTAVARGALGRYGEALDLVLPLTLDGPDQDDEVCAAACATAASLLRQIGDHPAGDPLDRRGLDLLDRLPAGAAADTRLDCAVGWTADAVGLGNLEAARDRLDAARTSVTAAHSWRPLVRLHWVETEVALMAGDVATALAGATAAVELAGAADAVRHLTKSSMFLGVSQALDGDLATAGQTLRTAAEAAERHRLLPLVWPIRAVLATMPGFATDPADAAKHLAAARSAVRTIGAGLPASRRDTWSRRDPMAAFLL